MPECKFISLVPNLKQDYPNYVAVLPTSLEGQKLYNNEFQQIDSEYTGRTYKLVGRDETDLTCGDWAEKLLFLLPVILTLGLILISATCRDFLCKTKNETLFFDKNVTVEEPITSPRFTTPTSFSVEEDPDEPGPAPLSFSLLLKTNEPAQETPKSSGPSLPSPAIRDIPKSTLPPPSATPTPSAPPVIIPTAVLRTQFFPSTPPLPPIAKLELPVGHLLNKGLSLYNIIEANPLTGISVYDMWNNLETWTRDSPFDAIRRTELWLWIGNPKAYEEWPNRETTFLFTQPTEVQKYTREIRKKYFTEIRARIDLLEKEIQLSERLKSHPLRYKFIIGLLAQPWSTLRLILVDDKEFQQLKVSDLPLIDSDKKSEADKKPDASFFQEYCAARISEASTKSVPPSTFSNFQDTLLVDLPYLSATQINEKQASTNVQDHVPDFVFMVLSPSEVPNIQLEQLNDMQRNLLLERRKPFEALLPEQLQSWFYRISHFCLKWLSPQRFLDLIRNPDTKAKMTKEICNRVEGKCWEAITLPDLKLIADLVPDYAWGIIPVNVVAEFFDPTKTDQARFNVMFPTSDRTKTLFEQIGWDRLKPCVSYFARHHLEKLLKTFLPQIPLDQVTEPLFKRWFHDGYQSRDIARTFFECRTLNELRPFFGWFNDDLWPQLSDPQVLGNANAEGADQMTPVAFKAIFGKAGNKRAKELFPNIKAIHRYFPCFGIDSYGIESHYNALSDPQVIAFLSDSEVMPKKVFNLLFGRKGNERAKRVFKDVPFGALKRHFSHFESDSYGIESHWDALSDPQALEYMKGEGSDAMTQEAFLGVFGKYSANERAKRMFEGIPFSVHKKFFPYYPKPSDGTKSHWYALPNSHIVELANEPILDTNAPIPLPLEVFSAVCGHPWVSERGIKLFAEMSFETVMRQAVHFSPNPTDSAYCKTHWQALPVPYVVRLLQSSSPLLTKKVFQHLFGYPEASMAAKEIFSKFTLDKATCTKDQIYMPFETIQNYFSYFGTSDYNIVTLWKALPIPYLVQMLRSSSLMTEKVFHHVFGHIESSEIARQIFPKFTLDAATCTKDQIYMPLEQIQSYFPYFWTYGYNTDSHWNLLPDPYFLRIKTLTKKQFEKAYGSSPTPLARRVLRQLPSAVVQDFLEHFTNEHYPLIEPAQFSQFNFSTISQTRFMACIKGREREMLQSLDDPRLLLVKKWIWPEHRAHLTEAQVKLLDSPPAKRT